MTARALAKVIVPAKTRDGAGVDIKRSIGTAAVDHIDPFYLFDEFGSDNPDDYLAGFPMHPHRGIETITYVLAGHIAHRDSLGNVGNIGPGGVQWMTAGSGILHEELPQREGNRLQGVQIWLNLPSVLKMTEPRYRNLSAGEIPEFTRSDGTRVRIIAGQVDGRSGAVTEVFADPTYLDIAMPAGNRFVLPVLPDHTALLYVFEGEVVVESAQGGDGAIAATRLAHLSSGDEVRLHSGSRDARLLLLSAPPLNEPAFRWGPFVMNTREQIEQALAELNQGKFVKHSPAGKI